MTDIINPVTAAIIKEAKDGDTIREIAMKTGFAYSAVYGWVMELAKNDMFEVKDEGNRKRIYAKHTALYNQFAGLIRAVSEAEQDKAFWAFVRKTKLNVRLAGGAAISLWTRGSYITGDFFDRVYILEVATNDSDNLKNELNRHKISYTEGDKKETRPLVFLTIKNLGKTDVRSTSFSIEKIEGIPVMPLKELVAWCKKLNLDAVLEQLDALYNLGLKTKYSEVHTNV
ncbi:MAG: helix-turn-helix domain-containing protein [Candidatus Aenigmatarchaeota archaeon]